MPKRVKRDEILRHLSNGMTQEETARRVKCSRRTVVRVKRDVEKRVRELVRQGLNVKQISEKLGVSMPFVNRIVMKMAYEIPVKGVGEVNFDPSQLKIGGGEEGGEESPNSSNGPQNGTGGERNVPEEEESSTKLLRGILERVRGISEDTIASICDFFNEQPEAYESNPANLLGLLQAFGVKPAKASFVVSQFMTALHGVPVTMPLGAPWNPGQQGWSVPVWPWYGHNGREREEEKRRVEEERRKSEELDRYFKHFLQASTIQMLRGGGQSAWPPWMSVTFEPVLDASGKPVKDEMGNPIMKTIASPGMFPGMQRREGEGFPSFFGELVKMEKERANEMEKRYLDALKTMSEERIRELQEQVAALSTRNPLALAEETLKRLKEMGVLTPGGQSLEIAKLNTDLQKWMHEQQIAMEKWREEMADRREERIEARERMREFGNIVRQGISELGSPVVKAFSEGYLSASKESKKKISDMTTAELEAYLREAPKVKQKIDEGVEAIKAELARRGVLSPTPASPSPESPSPGAP